jgi:hypothetical protein
VSEYKRQIGVAIVVAVMGVLALATAASYFVPGGQSTVATHTVTSTTGPCTVGCGLSTYTFSFTSTTGTPSPMDRLVAAVESSPTVQDVVSGAYYSSVLGEEQNPANDSQVFIQVFVVQNQDVSGNWTTEYTLTYTGRAVLNVTVDVNLLALQSTYKIDGYTLKNLPDQTTQLNFNATQRQAIQVALSNSTVRSVLDGAQFYIWNQPPTGPGYYVQINQVNNKNSWLVFVNQSETSVVWIENTGYWLPYLAP